MKVVIDKTVKLSGKPSLTWDVSTAMVAMVVKPGISLGLYIGGAGNRLIALALEIPDGKKGRKTTITDILDNHSHESLGEFTDIAKAEKACEKYAKKWLAKTKYSKCECQPISLKKAKK